MTVPYRRRAASVVAIAAMATLAVTPAAAAPPDRFETDAFIIALDSKHGLVVFWNISRDDYCAWEASGFIGPAPVTQLVPAQEHLAHGEVLMGTFGGTSSLELWMLDADADLSGPCQDTDGQAGPWATGTATLRGADNDIAVSLTRTNAFGGHLAGRVVDVDGNTWQFMHGSKQRINRNGEFFLMNERSTLARGN